ncbi:MAG: mechanosensitive ion channel [Bacteroidetes bacterium]|nr:MAG: mechanosensitive ion channel [Bacteroidota bacterium]
MLSYTLFKIGPYDVCLWNLIIWSLIVIFSMALRRIITRTLKKTLQKSNIRIEGRKITWLKLVSQSIYVLAVYIAILSFRINNEEVTFEEFLNYNLIESKKFTLSFYHIMVLILIFFLARVALNIVNLYLSKKFRKSNEYNAGTEYVYQQIAKYVVYIFAIFSSLRALDIDITLLITSSVGIFVGLGLGLQDVFKDMFAGVVLLLEGNIKVGDVIEISNGGKSDAMVAKILKVNVRTTHIETREGNVLIIPNTKLTQEFVENWSHGSPLSRFKLPVTVAYGSNTELVSRLLKQAAMGHPKVKKNEPVDVRLKNFGDNGLEMELIFWADQSWDVQNYMSEIRFEIDRLFREYQISIPYPQRDLHIRQGYTGNIGEQSNPFKDQ